jgi:hypothetical protein
LSWSQIHAMQRHLSEDTFASWLWEQPLNKESQTVRQRELSKTRRGDCQGP